MVFKKHINKLLLWQQKRAGLMNHIMLQKMGLYYHTGATDIAPNTTVSVMYYGMEICTCRANGFSLWLYVWS